MEAFALKFQDTTDGSPGMCWGRDGFELWLRTDAQPEPTFTVTLLVGCSLIADSRVDTGWPGSLLPEVRTRSYLLAFYLMTWFLRCARYAPDSSVIAFWMKQCRKLHRPEESDPSAYRVLSWGNEFHDYAV